MMKEIADTTLESLLSLALGTPEIGAVNFNYLYEVILQILKHLGISEKILNHESQINKVARLSTTRLSSNILPKDPPNNELISSHEDTSPALPEPLLSTLVKNEESAESSGLNLLSNSFEIPNASSKKSIANVEQNRKTSSNHIKLTEQEKSIVNLKRRDSETPTSDMWQILNKRLEGVETAVKETMNFVNNIHSSSEDLKRIPTDVTSSSTISSPEEFVNTITERVRQLGEKMLDMEEKLSAFPTKAELNCICTEDKVVALIKEYSDLFNNKIKEELRINKDEIRINKDELSMNKDENKEPKTKVSVKKLEYSDERQNFDAKDVKSSNTSIVNAFSNKEGFLEENIATVKEKIQKLETSLASKPDMQLLIDLKTDLREINRAFQSFTEKFTDLSKQSTSLEKSHSLTSGELGVLSLKQAEFEAQQKKMLKNMQQLEHNLEDVVDNFNKKQSELLKLQPKINPIDETVITKIRSSIFDMQEQYSKLQQQIDSLVLKSSDNNTKFFDIQKLVESLKEKMIDKFDIESLIAHKADLLLVENKIDRNQFNAFVLEMEQNFKGIVQKVDETEVSTNKTINDLEQVLNTKTNKEELNELRNYIDFRFNSFKPKIFQIKEAQDEAAGSRKQLMKNCNCISCDRPVALQNIHPGLTLPYYDPLPVKKAFRPVTPFELQTIRHNQQSSVYGNSGRIEISKERSKLQKELLQLCGVKDLEELSFQTNRACGGAHTLIEQHKRNPSKQPMLQQEEPIDVLGRDGHIYKGNLQTPLADIPRSPFKSETETAEPYENVESVISQLSNHKNGSPVET